MRTRLIPLTFLCLILLFAVLDGELRAQSQSPHYWKMHSGWTRFFPDNEYSNQVVDLSGILSSVYEDIPVLDGFALGLGYQRSLRPKVAIELSGYVMQGKKEMTEWYWRRQARNGVDLSDIKTTSTHVLRMTWLNLEVFIQQHWRKGGLVELGMGLGASWQYQHFRSGFVYNELLGQMDKEEYTRKRTLGMHLPMSLRTSFPITERWRIGSETTGMVFFKSEMLLYVGVAAHYQIQP